MYAYLKGKLEETAPDNVVLEVSGVGYNVKVSESTLSMLPPMQRSEAVYLYNGERGCLSALWIPDER